MLNLLEPYDLKRMGPQSAEALHLMIEAKKLAYEDRAKYLRRPRVRQGAGRRADLEGVRRPARADLIDLDQASERPMPGEPGEADTIYLTVVDKDLNAVSLIQSNFSRVRLVPRARRPGLRAPEPRLPVRARPDTRQPPGAAQAAVPHDHPRLRHQGRQALAELRPDGRRHAGAGARAGALQPDRLRHGRAGGRRRPPVPPLRLVRADRPARQGRRLGRARVGHRPRGPPRPGGQGTPPRHQSAAASAATRRSGSTSSTAS